jgi:uncharacterized protein
VHISELSSRYIKDPSEAVKVGQIVKVKVLSADAKSKRIGLSIKALEAPRERPAPKPKQQQKPSIEQQVAALNSRFRTR